MKLLFKYNFVFIYYILYNIKFNILESWLEKFNSSNWIPENWTPLRDLRRLPPKSGSLWYGPAVPEPQAQQWSRDAIRNTIPPSVLA
jgi:hypothetical protein